MRQSNTQGIKRVVCSNNDESIQKSRYVKQGFKTQDQSINLLKYTPVSSGNNIKDGLDLLWYNKEGQTTRRETPVSKIYKYGSTTDRGLMKNFNIGDQDEDLVIKDVDKLKRLDASSSKVFNRFIVSSNQTRRRESPVPPNNFVFRKFDQGSMERISTLYKFGFNVSEKIENKKISQVLSQQIKNQSKQHEPAGSLMVCDLWSLKMQRKCLDRTRLMNERNIMQKYLYFQSKYSEEIKQQSLKKQEDRLNQPRSVYDLDQQDIVQSCVTQDQTRSRQPTKLQTIKKGLARIDFNKDMSKIVFIIKKFQEDNQKEIEATKKVIFDRDVEQRIDLKTKHMQRLLK